MYTHTRFLLELASAQQSCKSLKALIYIEYRHPEAYIYNMFDIDYLRN